MKCTNTSIDTFNLFNFYFLPNKSESKYNVENIPILYLPSILSYNNIKIILYFFHFK